MMRLIFLALGSVFVCTCAAKYPGNESYERFRDAANKGNVAELHALANELKNLPEASAQCLGQLSLAVAAFRAGEMEVSDRSFDRMDSICGDGGGLYMAIAMKCRAAIQKWAGNAQGGLVCVEKGMLMVDSIHHPDVLVDLLVVRAELLDATKDLDGAHATLLEAAAIAEKYSYQRGMAMIELNLGNLKFQQGRYPEALANYEKALDFASLNSYLPLAMNASNNIAAVAVMTNRFESAKTIFLSLLADSVRLGTALHTQVLSSLGFMLTKEGKHKAALAVYERCLSLSDSINDVQTRAKVLQHMSNSLWEMGKHVDCIAALQEALSIAERLKNMRSASELHWRLHERYFSLGRLPESLGHLKKQVDLADSLNLVRFNDQLARSEVLFETERKEHTIEEQEQALLLADIQDRKKSFQRNVSIGIAALLLLIAALLYRNVRTRKRLAEKEKELHGEQVDQLLSQQEIKSINAMLEGQEKERDRVAKDLHDRLGSMLGGIKAQLGALEDRVEQVQHDAQFQRVNKLLDETVGELRQISHDMAASTLSRFGLEKALNDLRDTIHISGRLSLEMKAFGLEQRLERSVEIAVYRIIQELVGNVLKHAKASELSIDVTRSPGRLSVIVSDNGIGFDTKIPAEGMGLGNVRSRAAALGGKVQVDSSPGKGTTVSMECPVVE